METAGTVSFTTFGAYTITGGSTTDLSTTESATVSYAVTDDDLVSLTTDDGIKYAKIAFGSNSNYIKNLQRKY